MTNGVIRERDVLVVAPFGKDAALIEKILTQSGFEISVLSNATEMVAFVPECAAAAIVSEEALEEDILRELAQRLSTQPPWSDFPILVLTGGGSSTADSERAVRSRARLGNVTLLERPLRPATLVSSVRSAVAARKRQYEIRDHLHERKLAEEALRNARDELESIVTDRTAALCRLSAQLLHVQDEERRRIARELHDSVGQYLAAIKISLDMLPVNEEDKRSLNDVRQLLDRAISETRTLSYLLHPPSLDIAGFASAASWYVEGFGKRSGIATVLKIPENLKRLPASVETALFRIMQEALTNVHRHSGSTRVQVELQTDESVATLTVIDCGRGIPPETLEEFTSSGTKVGVGLAGIRERVKELGGHFEIASGGSGTVLKACIPLSGHPANTFAGNPRSQIYSSLAS